MDPIVVTGGSGFIGRALVRHLRAEGHPVRIVDREAPPPDLAGPGVAVRLVDLADATAAREALAGADRVVHLAARIGGIGYIHRHPADILAGNARVQSAVLEAAAELDVGRLVYVSSSMVLERARTFPTPEEATEDLPPPRTAYGFSKLLGERLCRAFAAEHGLETVIARPFNAYGPGEAPGDEPGISHVIPDLVRRLLRGEDPLVLLGDGSQTRCFTHVRDVARGLALCLLHPDAAGEVLHISHPTETSIRELAGRLWSLTGREGSPRIRTSEPLPADVARRVPAVGRAREVLGFEAAVDLDEGLPETVAWLRRREAAAIGDSGGDPA